VKIISICILFLGGISAATNYQLSSVKVSGDSKAEILFTGTGSQPMPAIKVNENTLDLTFMGAELTEGAQGKLDIEAPHALIRRISVYVPEKDVVRARLVINGSAEGLKQRLTLARAAEGVKVSLDFPKGESATLNLLKEEQQPLSTALLDAKKKSPKTQPIQIFLIAAILLVAAAVTFLLVKAMKFKGGMRGTRKYLVEQLGYVSLGAKTGVSLIKVGREFVLIGVTPNQVTMLSSLPKLQEQYDDESQFERGAFQEAVAEEVQRLKSTTI